MSKVLPMHQILLMIEESIGYKNRRIVHVITSEGAATNRCTDARAHVPLTSDTIAAQ